MQEVLDPMQPAGGRLPVFMGGQSMGGTMTILTALRDQSAWQVCYSPPAKPEYDRLDPTTRTHGGKPPNKDWNRLLKPRMSQLTNS